MEGFAFCFTFCEDVTFIQLPIHVENREYSHLSLTQQNANRTGQRHLLKTFRHYGRVCLVPYLLLRWYIYSAPYTCIERRVFPLEFDTAEC